jgi:hypothetical protein
LPWQAEGTEKLETELFKRVSISGVKLTVVAPCFAAEIPFEGTLEPTVINGSRNGLKPSRLVFEPIGGKRLSLTTKDLGTEKELNSLFVSGEVKDNGESVQLMTLG